MKDKGFAKGSKNQIADSPLWMSDDSQRLVANAQITVSETQTFVHDAQSFICDAQTFAHDV